MKRAYKFLSLGALAMLLLLSTSCRYQQQPATPPDTRAADESAIRNLADEWAKAINAKDLERALSYYAADARVFPPNQPVATTGEERRKVWEQAFALPGFNLSVATTSVEASRAADLAYEAGTFEMTVNDKRGKPTSARGKYVVVWKKQADGSWKAVADIWNVDQ